MNKNKKFIDYLGKLKNEGNSELLENVISGFKTLVEYQVGGSVSDRQIDIMENSEDIEDMASLKDIDDDILTGDLDVPLDESTSDVKRNIYGNNSDISLTEDKGGISDESNAFTDEESIMEVGEGDIKGKLTPELYKRIAKEVNDLEQKQRRLAYKSSLRSAFVNDDERERYIKNQIAQAWRDKLVDVNVDPSVVKGLVPVALESIDNANKSLMESITLMGMMVDKG